MSQCEELGGKLPGSGDSMCKVSVLGKDMAGARICRRKTAEHSGGYSFKDGLGERT